MHYHATNQESDPDPAMSESKNSEFNQGDIQQMQLHAADAAGLMKALGNESRLMILCTLAAGERSVGDLNEVVPLSQ